MQLSLHFERSTVCFLLSVGFSFSLILMLFLKCLLVLVIVQLYHIFVVQLDEGGVGVSCVYHACIVVTLSGCILELRCQ